MPQGRSSKKILETCHTCPIPRSSGSAGRCGSWGAESLDYIDTGGSSDGGTKAINGLIALHRGIARGFRNRDKYRLQMLLMEGGLKL